MEIESSEIGEWRLETGGFSDFIFAGQRISNLLVSNLLISEPFRLFFQVVCGGDFVGKLVHKRRLVAAAIVEVIVDQVDLEQFGA